MPPIDSEKSSSHCPGTRQPVTNRVRPRPTYYTGTYADRYGRGNCQVCGKLVTCHKDKTAVAHKGLTVECGQCAYDAEHGGITVHYHPSQAVERWSEDRP